MKRHRLKVGLLMGLIVFAFGFMEPLFADSISVDTVLTDKLTAFESAGEPKDTFSTTTPEIYLLFKSAEFKNGQKIKSVWIADDTNKAAPDNYKIDQAEIAVTNGTSGKFTMSKPSKDWPEGKYHVDIYVNGDLVKTVKFTITDTKKVASDEQSKASWGAISADSAKGQVKVAHGIGGGDTKEEADANAQKFCKGAGGEKCEVMVSYQHCGAFAVSKEHFGAGKGTTKKEAEDKALSECTDNDCEIVASDCN